MIYIWNDITLQLDHVFCHTSAITSSQPLVAGPEYKTCGFEYFEKIVGVVRSCWPKGVLGIDASKILRILKDNYKSE